ncbi:MAG: hypothetical protein U1E43_07695 [Rhodospirillales bacterium]
MSDAPLRAFATFLGAVEDGRLADDLTEALAAIVADLADHARELGGRPSARLAITLDFKLDRELVEVSAELKTTLPKRPRGRSVFWPTPDNHLSRHNPRQHKLPLRDVSLDQSQEIL